MHRRDLLKLLIPATVLPLAGYAGWRFWREPGSCELPDEATLLSWLAPLADTELGRLATLELPPKWMSLFTGACAGNIVGFFRERAAADFVAGRVIRVDGWLLSETEAFTHRAVYLAGERRGGARVPSP